MANRRYMENMKSLQTYLDEKVYEKLRQHKKEKKINISEYIEELIKKDLKL